MKLHIAFLLLLAVLLTGSGAQALRAFSGDLVSIDNPIEDDVFAAGSIININAPVDSLVAAGGTLNINAPVKGDVIAAGGQVYVNSDVGGKLVAMGGNVNVGGNIGTNAVAAGGQINILPGMVISRDAMLAGGNVVNAGHINGTLAVSSDQFSNTGSAQKVEFHKLENKPEDRTEDRELFNLFGLLIVLGYFILGLLLVKYLPGAFFAVDAEIRDSTLLKTILGFVLIVASFIAMLLLAVTLVGIPIALVLMLLVAVSLMLAGTFVSYSLGKWIGERAKLKYGDLVLFTAGFVLLNILLLLPFVGGLISIVSMSLGFASIIYAARRLSTAQARAASG